MCVYYIHVTYIYMYYFVFYILYSHVYATVLKYEYATAQDQPIVDSSYKPSIPEEEGDDLGVIDLPARAPTTNLHRPLCESTGLYFPSTVAMELLPLYDDGLSPLSLLSQDGTSMSIMDDVDKGTNGVGELIFCRI